MLAQPLKAMSAASELMLSCLRMALPFYSQNINWTT
jgi:hypothetical protein